MFALPSNKPKQRAQFGDCNRKNMQARAFFRSTAELQAETEATRAALTTAAKEIASQIATKATGRDFAVG